MRILEPERRDAMYAIYAFCRAVDDIADEEGDAPALARSTIGARDLDELYRRPHASAMRRSGGAGAPLRLERADFEAVIDGMAMDVDEDICAPDWATLDLYCDHVASAVGRLSVRAFGLAEASAAGLAGRRECSPITSGRALQLTNILRDLDEDAARGRLYLPREALEAAGVTVSRPAPCSRIPASTAACAAVARARAQALSSIGARSRACRARGEGALPHGRRPIARSSIAFAARGFAPPREPVPPRATKSSSLCSDSRFRVTGTTHIIGAGLAGLSCAVRSPTRAGGVALLRSRAHGGRTLPLLLRRTLDLTIDNGNHLLLSGNAAARDYARRIGAGDELVGPKDCAFDFLDTRDGERWRCGPTPRRLPWWIFVGGSPRARHVAARLSRRAGCSSPKKARPSARR